MKKLSLVGLLMLISCAYISPIDVNKESYMRLPTAKTPLNGITVSAVPSLENKMPEILTEVDRQFDEFKACMMGNGFLENVDNRVKEYRVIVVTDIFECPYHGGRCAGEYDPKRRMILAAYQVAFREGLLPLFKHELAHLYKVLQTDHSNLERVKICTKY
jgi:hypothetical protein